MNRGPELLARDPQPRIRCIEGDPEHLGDLRDRLAVNVVQDEDRPSIELELIMRLNHEPSRLRRGDLLVGGEGSVDRLLGRIFGDFTGIAGEAAVVRGEPEGDPEEPWSERARSIELRQEAVDGDKHVVRDVLEIGFADAEPAEGVEYIGKLGLKKVSEGRL